MEWYLAEYCGRQQVVLIIYLRFIGRKIHDIPSIIHATQSSYSGLANRDKFGLFDSAFALRIEQAGPGFHRATREVKPFRLVVNMTVKVSILSFSNRIHGLASIKTITR